MYLWPSYPNKIVNIIGTDCAQFSSIFSGMMSKAREAQQTRGLFVRAGDADALFDEKMCLRDPRFQSTKDHKLVKLYNIRLNKNWQSIVREDV